MKNRSFYSLARQRQVTKLKSLRLIFPVFVVVLLTPPLARAGDAPQWMHALINAPLPAHDDRTNAVLLYSEDNVTVISTDRIKTVIRRAYKILRPEGREYGLAFASFRSPGEKINSMHGWCIPAQGKDYEVKDKEAVEGALPKVDGSELITDVRVKFLRIPATDPGNIVGYEYEIEEQPLVLQHRWTFQEDIPVAESHYSLHLPAGWEYKAFWLNYPEAQPTVAGSNEWRWTVKDVKEIRAEEDMPPMRGLLGQMVVSFFPAGGFAQKGFANWQQMGTWYAHLANGRRDATPEIKQKVAALTSGTSDVLGKMKNLANFVQHEIRYVAIELGIGGWQPHAAGDVFSHRYGDCKDKATLMASMLQEIGVESYYTVINTRRGSVTYETPAYTSFNHVILAIKLPSGLNDASLVATTKHSKLGPILFFDPTNELTPFGQITGHLQANYGLVVTPDGGELIKLPTQPPAMNSIRRSARLSLDATGKLQGEVAEVRMGDRAWSER